MVLHFLGLRNWWQALGQRRHPTPTPTPTPSTPLPPSVFAARPPLDVLAQPDYPLPPFVQACPVAQKYLTLLGALPWSHFPERPRDRAWPGPTPAPRAPFVAAFLVQLVEQQPTLSALARFLAEHPALLWLLGFPLVPEGSAPHGFDVAASVPSRRRLAQVLRTLSNEVCQWLLDQSVQLIREALPPEVAASFGQVVSGDTKHILAWVKENNPKCFIKEGRYDKQRQPKGDPDCKLGAKSRRNRAPAEGGEPPSAPTPSAEPRAASALPVGSELYWGYASGVLVTKVAEWGEVVLAERTDSFDKSDISYFHPLLADGTRRLGFRPPYGAWDAAYDAWYVHEYFHEAGGFAAVPFVAKGKPAPRDFDGEGRLLCAAGLLMPQLMHFEDRTTSLLPQPKGKFGCPLRHPTATGEQCPVAHAKWPEGGCTTVMGTSVGARLRYTLDRQSAAYKDVYRQRTASERINSQATELGIERPKLRNRRSITNRNTLLYVLLNLRTLQRIRAQRAAPPTEEAQAA